MLSKIFSVKNEKYRKTIYLFGIKITIKRKLEKEIIKKEKKILEQGQINNEILEEILFYLRRENPSKTTKTFPVQNLKLYMAKIAAKESARYIIDNFITAPVFKKRNNLLNYALKQVDVDGLYLEFGVFRGTTINYIAKKKPEEIIYGFDSFEGLPETWQEHYQKGHFKLEELPNVAQNVKLIKGWFEETLPDFVKEIKDKKIAFIHNDSDLYSSTKTMLTCLKNNIQSGTVIVFDEYLNYPGWQNNEYKAFQEFINETGFKYEYIGYVPNAKQVAVKIL